MMTSCLSACAKVHLNEGLYVQALSCRDLSTAVAALGTLIIMRSFCRARHDPRQTCRKTSCSLVQLRAVDLQRAIANTLNMHTLNDKLCFVFRTRFAIKGLELATPSRRELQAALEDWVVMIWAMDALDTPFERTDWKLPFQKCKKRKATQTQLLSEVCPGRLKILKIVSDFSMPRVSHTSSFADAGNSEQQETLVCSSSCNPCSNYIPIYSLYEYTCKQYIYITIHNV